MEGYLIVLKAKYIYMVRRPMSLSDAKIELMTTAARKTGSRGRNTKAWFLSTDLYKRVLDGWNPTTYDLDQLATKLTV